MWHGYVGFQDLNLNAAQRAALWQVFKNLPPALVTGQPQHKNQLRFSLDNRKAICELLFNAGDVTIANIRQKLAHVFEVDVANIAVAQTVIEVGWSHSPVWTFRYGGTSYLRVVVFGGMEADWKQSRDAALDYVRQNRAEWDLDPGPGVI